LLFRSLFQPALIISPHCPAYFQHFIDTLSMRFHMLIFAIADIPNLIILF